MSLTSHHPWSVCEAFKVVIVRDHLTISEYLADHTIQLSGNCQVSISTIASCESDIDTVHGGARSPRQACNLAWPENYGDKLLTPTE